MILLTQNSIVRYLKTNIFLTFFVFLHLFLALAIGETYFFAPDEYSYLFTFNNIYSNPHENPQFASGWISTPQLFLWIVFLPAKIINFLGIGSTLALRMLSIALISGAYILLRIILRKNSYKSEKLFILNFAFIIPSVFVWTSLGLREAYIFFGMALFSFSIWQFIAKKNSMYLIPLSLSGYFLLCVKNYLFFIFFLSLISIFVLSLLRRKNRISMLKASFLFLVIPLTLYRATSTPYAFEFMYSSLFQGNISDVGKRSGESITIVEIPGTQNPGTQNPGTQNPGTQNPETQNPETQNPGTQNPGTQKVILRGDYTLIAAHDFLNSRQDNIVKKILISINFKNIVDQEYEKKLVSALLNKNRVESKGIITPGHLGQPLTLITSSLYFMLGPFPPNQAKGFFGYLISFESPIWWVFYFVIGIQVFYRRKNLAFDNLITQIHFVILIGLVLMSSLVEVNIGTAFRHKTILIVPLLTLMFSLSVKRTLDDKN